MGLEATCLAEIDGQPVQGKALLETDELLFRGPIRLRIPFSEMAPPEIAGGLLRICFGGRVALFHLGPEAEKWAARIRSPRSLLDKLGVKPGQRVAVLGSVDAAFLADLVQRVPSCLRGKLGAELDLLFVGLDHRDELQRLPALTAFIKRSGSIWVIRPRGTADITDAEVRNAAAASGLVDVKVVRFSETHTAEKLIIPIARR